MYSVGCELAETDQTPMGHRIRQSEVPNVIDLELIGDKGTTVARSFCNTLQYNFLAAPWCRSRAHSCQRYSLHRPVSVKLRSSHSFIVKVALLHKGSLCHSERHRH